jgi:hypothetical protein
MAAGNQLRRALRFAPMALVFAWITWSLIPRSLPHPEALESAPLPVEGSVEQQQAGAILAHVQAAYTSAASYRDEGWIRNVRIDGNDRKTISVEHFRLALARPDRFVWQWREYMASRSSKNEFVDLLQRGHEVHFHSRQRGEISLGERQDALAMIAAWDFRDLLQLLFPNEMGGRALLERLTDARVVGIESVEGRPCLRIEGIWPDHDGGEPTQYALWVDRSTYHLRRLFERAHIADWILESTHVFAPEGGAAISEMELGLNENWD